ncbi:MAG: DUF5615 family PIN-like protein [Lewinellaceae bacterium]|nr:DUF5615 family PIN-like protein [Lewinellaceae bacterium]MCB9282660.1 DUF5615 family PIN-like protein [Lewinellaceae bacterium]
MLLLFDQNLSYKLVSRLSDIFPGSTHVRAEGLDQANDQDVWEFARDNGYTIVSQDGDFLDIGLLNGAPPKVIWLRCGNTSTSNIEAILRSNYNIIEDFILNLQEICLELY